MQDFIVSKDREARTPPVISFYDLQWSVSWQSAADVLPKQPTIQVQAPSENSDSCAALAYQASWPCRPVLPNAAPKTIEIIVVCLVFLMIPIKLRRNSMCCLTFKRKWKLFKTDGRVFVCIPLRTSVEKKCQLGMWSVFSYMPAPLVFEGHGWHHWQINLKN